jgi:hypothetical protein
MMNSLANHGLIPRKDITSEQLRSALTAVKLAEPLINVLAGDTAFNLGHDSNGSKVLNLSELDKHGGIEHVRLL